MKKCAGYPQGLCIAHYNSITDTLFNISLWDLLMWTNS